MCRIFTTLLLLTALLTFHTLHAQIRTPFAARQIAVSRLRAMNDNGAAEVKEFELSQNIVNKIKTLQRHHTTSKPFVCYGSADMRNIVIVSADERMRPVLGECNNANLRPDSLPCGLIGLLAHYADQYTALQENNIDTLQQSVPPRYYVEVSPLIASQWGQDSPYNDDCPDGCPSGCVATAMAQIMRFYGYPATGDGSFSYTSETNRYKVSYNFAEANFNWTDMKNKYSTGGFIGATEDGETGNGKSARSAVANLMKACGVSVGMDYASDGSGAHDADIPYALINFFAYNSTVVGYQRSYFNNEQWYDKVHEELDAGRPILYCGQDSRSNSGHAFIVDGYRQSDGKFHLNWGWDGSFNGYYELDALNPSTYRFSSSQSMIARFCPDETGLQEDVFCAESFKADSKPEAEKKLTCTLRGVYNFSSSSSYAVGTSAFNGVIGVGLYNEDFNFVRTLAEEEVNDLRTFYGYNEASFDFVCPNEAASSSETWYLVPYAKATDNPVPTPIRTLGALTDYIVIGQTESGGGDDKPVIPDGNTILKEYFNDFDIPDGWQQEQVLGKGNWQNRLVISGDDNTSTPPPFEGRGYAFLAYNSGSAFANARTITRLITPSITGISGEGYMLRLQCRKFSSKVGTSDILSIYIDRGCNDNWELLTEQAVTNSTQWLPVELGYAAEGNYRLAIEGSLEYRTNIYIDGLTVYRDDTLPTVSLTQKEKTYDTYSVNGQRTLLPTRGPQIRRYTDGAVEKVYRK